MYRFTGFTEKSNNAMNIAISTAQDMGHNYIGSEHVLFGLLSEGSGVAFNVLNKLGVTADAYEKLMREKIGTSTPTTLSAAYFTPRTKRILQMAKLAASKLGSKLRRHGAPPDRHHRGRRELRRALPADARRRAAARGQRAFRCAFRRLCRR